MNGIGCKFLFVACVKGLQTFHKTINPNKQSDVNVGTLQGTITYPLPIHDFEDDDFPNFPRLDNDMLVKWRVPAISVEYILFFF